MQVLCHPSDGHADIQCPVCNQGFRVFWERSSAPDQKATLPEIYQELRNHHRDASVAAHPDAPFNIPSWSGLPHFSAAALLGGAY
ncbi:hypothetical protein [Edaphobacter modestus]|uniref:Uncharacterized protein n=1 Tax=Edaphobacter modestus TaxID=388466 RepID=A0A4Q7YVM4_9BACT|nr:hypothetical protein [Edaphobacter modestus]RZU41708.1 hypothetical protein BDD14_3236 [Edaphobacter modestus]